MTTVVYTIRLPILLKAARKEKVVVGKSMNSLSPQFHILSFAFLYVPFWTFYYDKDYKTD